MFLKRLARKLRFAVLLIRMGGLMVFLHQLRRQIYSRTTYFGMVKNLDDGIVKLTARIPYTLQLASPKDMEEILQVAKLEDKQSAHELVQRLWFYESGFQECHLARSAETGEPCHIHWMVFPHADDIEKQGFRRRLPDLRDDEVLGENAYTFEKYRGYRLASAIGSDLYEIARARGAKHWIGYVREDNVAMQKSEERAGFKRFETMHELKLFFFTMRSHRPHQPPASA